MSSYTEDQIHQLANALETAGYTQANIMTLRQSPELLAQIKLVLTGLATIVRAGSELEALVKKTTEFSADQNCQPSGESVEPLSYRLVPGCSATRDDAFG